jgi:large conductance mechanosensitive channel
MLKEFRDFAVKGNALDLAVAVVIGAAFGAVVNSLVNDLLMPPIGKLLGGVDFSNFFLVLGSGSYPTVKAAKEAGAATLNYGIFINTIINFVIIAFALFIVVRSMNRLRTPAPAAAPTTKDCRFCATAIPLAATRCPHCTSNL